MNNARPPRRPHLPRGHLHSRRLRQADRSRQHRSAVLNCGMIAGRGLPAPVVLAVARRPRRTARRPRGPGRLPDPHRRLGARALLDRSRLALPSGPDGRPDDGHDQPDHAHEERRDGRRLPGAGRAWAGALSVDARRGDCCATPDGTDIADGFGPGSLRSGPVSCVAFAARQLDTATHRHPRDAGMASGHPAPSRTHPARRQCSCRSDTQALPEITGGHRKLFRRTRP